MSNLAICLVICALTMVSYIIGKLPMGLTALLSMLAFVLTGCLDPGAALGYFGNANGIMMVSMFASSSPPTPRAIARFRVSRVCKKVCIQRQ
jgi:hypothetical protein